MIILISPGWIEGYNQSFDIVLFVLLIPDYQNYIDLTWVPRLYCSDLGGEKVTVNLLTQSCPIVLIPDYQDYIDLTWVQRLYCSHLGGEKVTVNLLTQSCSVLLIPDYQDYIDLNWVERRLRSIF